MTMTPRTYRLLLRNWRKRQASQSVRELGNGRRDRRLDELADTADRLFRPDLDIDERAREFLASLPEYDDDYDIDEVYQDARRQAWEAQQAKWVGSWSCVIGLAQEMAQPEHKTAPRHNARVATECVCWKGEA